MKNIDESSWNRYYEAESLFKQFTPEGDPYEEHRVKFTKSLLPRGLKEILDVGSGNGYLCSKLYTYGTTRVVGLDISLTRLADSVKIVPGATFIQGSSRTIPFSNNSFDLVTCIEVLEHAINPNIVLRELKRVARKWVIITVPYNRPPTYVLCPHCLKIFPVDGHINSFTPESLGEMAKDAGLIVTKIKKYYITDTLLQSKWPKHQVKVLLHQLRRLLAYLRLMDNPIPKYIGLLCCTE